MVASTALFISQKNILKYLQNHLQNLYIIYILIWNSKNVHLNRIKNITKHLNIIVHLQLKEIKL